MTRPQIPQCGWRVRFISGTNRRLELPAPASSPPVGGRATRRPLAASPFRPAGVVAVPLDVRGQLHLARETAPWREHRVRSASAATTSSDAPSGDDLGAGRGGRLHVDVLAISFCPRLFGWLCCTGSSFIRSADWLNRYWTAGLAGPVLDLGPIRTTLRGGQPRTIRTRCVFPSSASTMLRSPTRATPSTSTVDTPRDTPRGFSTPMS